MPIASGAVPNTRTKKIWSRTALALKRTITTKRKDCNCTVCLGYSGVDIWIRILHELFYATLKDRETTVGFVLLRNVSEQKVRMSPILPGKEGAVKTVDG